ncbi:MAG: peptidyl-prolyl cis-trans isomerase [Acidobacteriota bacterium]
MNRSFLPVIFLSLLALPVSADTVFKVVMNVNDEIHSLYEYQQRKTELERSIQAQTNISPARRQELLDNLPKQVFRQMYEELLLLSRARRAGVFVSEEDVDKQIGRIQDRFGIENEEEFQLALAQNGMRIEDLREQTRRQMMIDNLLFQEVSSKIEVPEEVLRRYYRENPDQFTQSEKLRLQEIVVLEDSGLSEDELARIADEVRAAVAAGGDLAKIAETRSSSGETSALIELGWISSGDLSKDLEEAVWDLEVDQISAPVAARGGLHLVQVLEREEAVVLPYTEVSDRIRRREENLRYGKAVGEFMERLESEAWVELDPPPEAVGFRDLGSGTADEKTPPPPPAEASDEDAADPST